MTPNLREKAGKGPARSRPRGSQLWQEVNIYIKSLLPGNAAKLLLQVTSACLVLHLWWIVFLRSSGNSYSSSIAWSQQSGNSKARDDFIKEMVLLDLEGLDDSTKQEKLDLLRANEFAFFRGTSRVYYEDIHSDSLPLPRVQPESKLNIWISGDAHVQNFGSFDDNRGTIVYDLNDFDEGFVADFRFDLVRASVSIILTCKENRAETKDWSMDICHEAVSQFLIKYLEQLRSFVGNDDEVQFQWTKKDAYGRLDDFLDDVERKKSRKKMLKKWTKSSAETGALEFDLKSSKLGPVDYKTSAALRAAITSYLDSLHIELQEDATFNIKDIAKRLKAGTGSYGTERYYALVAKANSQDSSFDDLILDVKVQKTPHTAIAMSESEQSIVMSSINIKGLEGARVSLANEALLSFVDSTVGNLTLFGRSFSVRQRSPYKDTFDLSELTSAKRLRKLSEQWGIILAAAHARSDNDFDDRLVPYSFEQVISETITMSKSTEFTEEVWKISNMYSEQVSQDFASFCKLFPQAQIS
mmetsp:Transcript_15707/g.30347  ORF Transcript_15707/g.30347 Transcript_15707/m.30347 type:complete len:527 (+) Transcript_15707:3-1583(+)